MDAAAAPFRPPFCPYPACRFHFDPRGWQWIRFGFYRRRCEPRIIQRFRCGQCGRRFSTQTFSTTYYLKRPELQIPFFYRLLACSGYRQIAREARCSPTTVMGQAARLGRHALLALHHLRAGAPVTEPLVIDGFESFAYSQYHPLHLHLAIGADSHFIYGFTHSELRRKGRMSERQRKIRASLERTFGRPDPKAIELDMASALKIAAPGGGELVIRSDEHPAYPRAFRRLPGWRIRHECTPSVAARTHLNPLFPVNCMDLLLRQNSANHKRETIAFSKRNQSVIERAALLTLWRNFTKPYSENHPGPTVAMRAGLQSRPLPVQELLKERLFPSRIELPDPWTHYYRRKVPTRRIGNPRIHDLVRAF
jgi:hypothetical protein